MTLGSDIDAALPALRVEAESRMGETVTVGSFADATDPVTFDPIRTIVSERYAGKGRIRYGSITASTAATGADQIAQPVAVQTPYLSVPWGSPRLFEGDEVLVDGSKNPLLVARTYQIAGNAVGDTAHRYPLTELS